eukprot:2447940-Amphidinium_carterae.1
MDDMEELEALAEEQEERPTGRGRGGGGRGRGGRGRKNNPPSKSLEEGAEQEMLQRTKCFVCDAAKLRNSRFCRPHHRAQEAMRYQAENEGELKLFY